MNKTTKLTLTALMAALCYVGFAVLQIPIQTPVGPTAFHLGNVFCVLTALLFDGLTGGIAGAIGMGIGDVIKPEYLITLPKTLFLKFFIGYITGFVAHKIFKIKNKPNKLKPALLSTSAGMFFNLIGEPIVSYLYYGVILENSEKALSYLQIERWITTSVNCVLAVVIATILYVAISKRIKFDK